MEHVGHYLVLSALVFSIGAVGVAIRRNTIVLFMCIELMLNAVNLSFIAISRALGNLDGQVMVVFVMVVAAVEAAVGLAIILLLFRNRRSVESGAAMEMRG